MMELVVELVATGGQFVIPVHWDKEAWAQLVVKGKVVWEWPRPRTPRRALARAVRAICCSCATEKGTSGTLGGKGNSNLVAALVTAGI